MAWIKRSDTAAMSPMVLAPLGFTDSDDGLDPHDRVNLLAGFVQRCADMSAIHETDYVASVGTVMTVGGPNWARHAAAAERAGYWTRLADGRGWLIVDDEQNFIHIRLKAEVEWERQRKRDNSNADLTVPVRLRDGDECRYCLAIVNWSSRNGGRSGTYDHRHKPARGPEDLVVACKTCNSRRRDLPDADKALPLQPPPTQPFYGQWTVALLAKHGHTVPLSAVRPASRADNAQRDPQPGIPRENGTTGPRPGNQPENVTATPPTVGHRAAGTATPQPVGHRARDPQPGTPRHNRRKPARDPAHSGTPRSATPPRDTAPPLSTKEQPNGGHDPPPHQDLPDPAETHTPLSGFAGTGRERDGTEAPALPDPSPNHARRRRARRAKPTTSREGKP